MVTLLFSGDIWNYYFSQFFGPTLFVIGLIASKSKPPRLFLAILTIFSIIHASSFMTYSPSRFDSSSWVLLTQIAKDGLSQPNTGYFLYSQDQFAYPLKYAFSYYRQTHQNMGSAPFEKRDLTVLVKAADDPRNPYSTSKDWQLNKVRINQNPIDMKSYPFGYVLEKYILNQENLQKPVDPNMITDLHFR